MWWYSGGNFLAVGGEWAVLDNFFRLHHQVGTLSGSSRRGHGRRGRGLDGGAGPVRLDGASGRVWVFLRRPQVLLLLGLAAPSRGHDARDEGVPPEGDCEDAAAEDDDEDDDHHNGGD